MPCLPLGERCSVIAARHGMKPPPTSDDDPRSRHRLYIASSCRRCGAGENRTPIAKSSGVTDRAHSTCSTPWKPSQTPAPPGEEGALLSRRQPTRSGESAQCRAEILHDAGSRAVKPQPTVTTLTGLTDHPADDARFALANLLRFTA